MKSSTPTSLLTSNRLIIWIVCMLFVLANGVLLAKGVPYLLLLPISLVGLVLVFISPQKTLIGLAFLAPLSIESRSFFPDISFSIILPTEPILLLFLVALVFIQLTPRRLSHDITYHPVSLAIYAFMSWLLISTAGSEYPLASVKYFLMKGWFFASFFFFAIPFFQDKKNIYRFFWAFITGLAIVAVYSLIKQAGNGLFSKEAAASAPCPFFNDHTSYAAAIAFIIPFLTILLFIKKSLLIRIITAFTLIFFIAALVLSYTRAAWLSLFFAVGIYILIHFRIRLRTIVGVIVIVTATLFYFQDEITSAMERTKAVSSTNLVEHLQSTINVSSDPSNAERVLRWHAAIELFKERPIIGWGPGTYIFVYGDFQIANDRTVISTNRGSGGNAHSEYLELLSESGILSLVLYLTILITVFYKGIRYYQRSNSWEMRMLVMASLLGISTYIMHSTLNDFLDMDEIAAPFWAFAAVVVAADISLKQSKRDEGKATMEHVTKE